VYKALPSPTPDSAPFWAGCALHELRYQRCHDCGRVQPLPRSLCLHCHGSALEWAHASGRGRILSFTVVHRAPTPAWREDVPYVIAIIDLDEGFRLMVNVAGGPQEGLAIEAPVVIGFVERGGVSLPEARLQR
jgi:hypothetical protein